MFLSGLNLGITTLKDNNLSLSESMILQIIWSFENKGNNCMLSRYKIAEYLNESKSTIARAIKSLKLKGFLFCSGKVKTLTPKGLGYCKEVFIFPKQKKNIDTRAIVPSWYEQYKKDVDKPKEQEPINQADVLEAIKSLFPDD